VTCFFVAEGAGRFSRQVLSLTYSPEVSDRHKSVEPDHLDNYDGDDGQLPPRRPVRKFCSMPACSPKGLSNGDLSRRRRLPDALAGRYRAENRGHPNVRTYGPSSGKDAGSLHVTEILAKIRGDAKSFVPVYGAEAADIVKNLQQGGPKQQTPLTNASAALDGCPRAGARFSAR